MRFSANKEKESQGNQYPNTNPNIDKAKFSQNHIHMLYLIGKQKVGEEIGAMIKM